MDLWALMDRVEYERGAEHEDKPVQIMTPSGRRYDLLSLNWDAEHNVWLLVGDRGD